MNMPIVGTKVQRQMGPQKWTGVVQHYREVPNSTISERTFRVVVICDAPFPGAIMRCLWTDLEVVTP